MRKKDHESSCRRMVIGAVAGLFAAQFAFGLLLDYRWPLVKFAEARKHLDRFDQLYKPGESPDVLVIGSSRPETGISEDAMAGTLRRILGDPSIRVFNSSLPGMSPDTTAYILERFFERGIRPRFVVTDTAPENLVARNPWIKFQFKRTMTWVDVPRYAGHFLAGRDLNSLVNVRFLPLRTYAPDLRELAVEAVSPPVYPRNAPDPEAIDWSTVEVPKEPSPDALAIMNAGNPFLRSDKNYSIAGPSPEYLGRIADRCRELGIVPIVYGAPVTTYHRAAYTPKIDRLYDEFTRTASEKHGFVFVDLRDAVPDSLFFDSHHISSNPGSYYFAEKFAREVLAPRWPRSTQPATPATTVSRPSMP